MPEQDKRTDSAPPETPHDVAHILESISDAFFALDRAWRFTYLNRQAERLLARTRDELLDANIWDEFPQAVGTASEREYSRAMAGESASFEQHYPPLGKWFEVRAYPSQGGIIVFFHDITERKRHEQDLRESEERYRLLLDTANEGVLTVDADDRIAYVNPRLAQMIGRRAEELRGRPVYDLLFPEDAEEARRRRGERRRGEQEQYEMRLRRGDGAEVWTVANVSVVQEEGRYAGTFSLMTDITSRRAAERELMARAEREALLNQIGQAIRATLDPEEIQQVAVRALGETLRADRCYFSLYDLGADLNWVGQDFRRDDLPSLAGRYRLSDFEVNPEDYYPGGRTFVVPDALDATWSFPEALLTAIHQLRVRSAVGVPFFSGGRLVATLSVAMADEPRAWTDDEVRLVEAVASLTRSAVEAARLLAERQGSLAREALMGRIGAALRSTLDPDLIQQRAGTLLGEALSADRCFYVTYDLARDRAHVSQDWRRDDLPSQAGEYRASDFDPLLGELFPAPQTAVVEDVRVAFSPAVASVFEATRHRAMLVVPFFDEGTLTAALYVSQADTPRAWTAEEKALAEQVATLTRTALQAARVQAREHRIASDLQAALQPDVPECVPGLSLGRLIQPALDEAEVGGDFYDMFPLDKGLYAVVIGDVSGKGLAAAQQLALIRNSLRTVLYQEMAPAQAAAAVNRIVTSHDLLIGFVTCWVGVYDAAASGVAYCSCGHEPGLVRRAGGEVEALGTTGPPLGVAENADYSERTFTLAEGDALLLYTDGVSEAGPSRRELLGTEGLKRVLAALPTGLGAQAQAEALVGDVKAFAGGAFRDDVAVLLVCRQ